MSGYNWREGAEGEGPDIAERIPKGKHRVTISKIVYGGQNGPFLSSKGDPQIMVIYADPQDREAGQMVTLSEKAGWVLAKILSACQPPADLDRMTQDGIEPQHFADPGFGDKQLVGRVLDVEVDWVDRNGSQYADVTPLKAPSTQQPTTAGTIDKAAIPI